MKIGQSAMGTPPPGHHLAIPNRLYTASAPVRRDIGPLVCHMSSPQCYLTSDTHCQFVLHIDLERFQFGILVLKQNKTKQTHMYFKYFKFKFSNLNLNYSDILKLKLKDKPPFSSHYMSPRFWLFHIQGTYKSLYLIHLLYYVNVFQIWQDALLLFYVYDCLLGVLSWMRTSAQSTRKESNWGKNLKIFQLFLPWPSQISNMQNPGFISRK